jgi:hypothetical protein
VKNSFVVNYAMHSWLIAMGVSISGPWGLFLIAVGSRILGSMLDRGIIELDITIDHLKQAAKDPQWRYQVGKIYSKTVSKVFDEKEKDEIRRQYMEVLNQYAIFANTPIVSDNQNP